MTKTMTPFDATTAADLVKQAREDDEERVSPGQWIERNTDTLADISRTRALPRAMADQLEAGIVEVQKLAEVCRKWEDHFTGTPGLAAANAEIVSLRSQLTTALRSLDEARGECERMRAVYEAALMWRREIIGERASYDLRLEAAIDEALSTKEPK